MHDFLIASAEESYDGRPIYLTQKDVRELQSAKAAIAAGVKTLMDEMGVGIEDIDRVYVAGALGNYVNPRSAMRIGLIPRFDPEILVSAGNAATTGAAMALLSKDSWQMANELGDSIEHIELSSRLDFNEYFIEQMDFPGENLLDIQLEEVEAVMRTIQVGDIMTRDFPTVHSTASLQDLESLLRKTGHHGFPVLDEEGHLFGVVTFSDLERSRRNRVVGLTVGDIATKTLVVAHPDQSLYDVLGATAEDYGRMPVVNRDDRDHLIGVLRRHDILRAYRKSLSQARKASEGH